MVLFGITILFDLMMQQRTQKTRFLNVGHSRKSQIAVIIQASWRNSILTFKRTNEMYNPQKHSNNPHLQPKIIGF